jgi:hypothetical protein
MKKKDDDVKKIRMELDNLQSKLKSEENLKNRN